MPDCRVTCLTCRTDNNLPRIWRWLCEDCAQEHADRHRSETGHRTELTITVEPTIEDLKRTCQVAARHRERFW